MQNFPLIHSPPRPQRTSQFPTFSPGGSQCQKSGGFPSSCFSIWSLLRFRFFWPAFASRGVIGILLVAMISKGVWSGAWFVLDSPNTAASPCVKSWPRVKRAAASRGPPLVRSPPSTFEVVPSFGATGILIAESFSTRFTVCFEVAFFLPAIVTVCSVLKLFVFREKFVPQ